MSAQILWEPVKGFEGFYEVSSDGEVKSLLRYVKTSRGNGLRPVRERLLKHVYSEGYPSVTLYRPEGNKRYRLHKLLAETFIENPNNYPIVRHLDDDRNNFNLSNLSWGTDSMNKSDALRNGGIIKGPDSPSGKLTQSDISGIRDRLEEGLLYQWEIGEIYKVNQSIISRIKTGVHYNEEG